MLKTSDKWYKELLLPRGFIILSPEGWDRNDFQFSWTQERIDKDEFILRAICSTTNKDNRELMYL